MTKGELIKRKDQLEAFMKTEACATMLYSIGVDIANIEKSILACPPDTESNRAHCNKLHGMLEVSKQALNLFQETLNSLNHRIAQCDEDGNLIEQDNNQ